MRRRPRAGDRGASVGINKQILADPAKAIVTSVGHHWPATFNQICAFYHFYHLQRCARTMFQEWREIGRRDSLWGGRMAVILGCDQPCRRFGLGFQGWSRSSPGGRRRYGPVLGRNLRLPRYSVTASGEGERERGGEHPRSRGQGRGQGRGILVSTHLVLVPHPEFEGLERLPGV